MKYHDKIQVAAIFIAPPDQAAEGARIWQSHASWMESTHHRSGEKALLSYNVSKAPELSDQRMSTLPRPATCVSS